MVFHVYSVLGAGAGGVRSAELRLTKQRADIAIGADKTRGIQDPSFDQQFEFGQFPWIKAVRTPQSVQIAVGVQTQLRWPVVPMGQFLASITERLEVSDRLGILQGCHDL